MPALARKLLVSAAVDGLLLQPVSRKDEPAAAAVKLSYGDASISLVARANLDLKVQRADDVSFESFGVAGLIVVSPQHSFLVCITRRGTVAVIRGAPIYVISEVTLIPCASQKEAADAVVKTRERRSDPGAGSDDDEPPPPPAVTESNDDVGDAEEATRRAVTKEPGPVATTVVDDVFGKRGFQRWFGRGGWLLDQQKKMGLTSPTVPASTAPPTSGSSSPKVGGANPPGGPASGGGAGEAADDSLTTARLLPKLLRTAQMLFGTSRSFYFSYGHDITRAVADQNPNRNSHPDQPLFRRVKPAFFWNRNMQRRFIDAGADAFVLPLMQGFVGQRSFVVDRNPPQTDVNAAKDSVEMSDFTYKPGPPPATASPPRSGRPSEDVATVIRSSERRFEMTLISRRSVRRAGLRYLRRGVDDSGNTANFVETEQILSLADGADPSAKTYSYVQIRGSIPLYFTQSPYALRPSPVIQHSPESNLQALSRHFESLGRHYGSLQVVSLVEKHGIESSIGQEFERSVEKLNGEWGDLREGGKGKIAFEWFDFHAACRGMKFENVSLLLDILGEKIKSGGSTVVVGGGSSPVSRQNLVIRTNCMDCLDRTNVCQSSFAKLMLELQLADQGFDLSAQCDQQTVWFNTLWADNGDALSKQYASTAAMKGDYTRFGSRTNRGALTDMGLSLSRFFSGMVNDFFVQTSIDFLLGNVTSLALEEFQVDFGSKDPAVSMEKLREQAIELCQKRVLADPNEEFIGGWTMITPQDPAVESLTGPQPYEEAVLLLTDVALYLCRFDWNLDKVASFERVDLGHVRRIRYGTYITATLSPTQIDPNKNQGILIVYRPGSNDVVRVNTRSMSSVLSTLSASTTGSTVDSLPPPSTKQQHAERTLLGPFDPAGIFTALRPAQAPTERRIVLKAPYSQSSLAETIASEAGGGGGGRLTEAQLILSVAAQLERLVVLNQPIWAGSQRKDLLEHGDIVSLAEARKSTGLLEHLGHSIKKLVWA